MTYADVVSQMQQIQGVLAGLNAQPTTSASSATSASDFASALDGASTTTAASASGSTTASAGTLVTAAGVSGDDVVADAKKYLGVPYVFGGESTSGMDCSGLVQKTFGDLGVSVPRLVHEQQTVGTKVDSLKDAKPGDLIVLNGGDHIAIYAGNDMVVHAPYAGRTVSLQKVWFTDKDVVTIRRIVPSSDDATPTTTAGTGTTATTAASGTTGSLSAATVARATALMAMYAGSGSGDSSSGSSSSSSTLAGLLGSTGTTSSTSTSSALDQLLNSQTGAGASTSTSAQLLAARAAALGAAS